MSGGGGSANIQETKSSKKLASIAAQRFNLYQKYHVPMENQFISEVQAMNTQASFDTVEGVVAASMKPQFQQMYNQVKQNLAQQNVDPSSGKYEAITSQVAQAEARGVGTGTASGLGGQVDRYYQGMQNVVALGQGQAGTSISGLGDIASMAGNVGRAQASSRLDRYLGRQEMAGTLVGTGLGTFSTLNSTPKNIG